MNTKLLSFTGVLAAGALALAFGAGCGGDDDEAPVATNTPTTNTPATNTPVTNTPVTNTPATNTPATNTPATNTPATNTPVTNTPVTNTPVTNTPVTNTPVTNTPATNTPAGACMAGPYLESGDLKGYCFALQVVGGVETPGPEGMTELSFAYSLPGKSWDDIAMIGCNVNQPVEGGEGSEGTLVPTGTTICIPGTGFERIQIQGPAGATSAEDRWCATPDASGCAALADFNTKCWDNTGTAYTGQPLAQVSALQPSKSDGVDVPETPLSGTICVTGISMQ